MATHSRILAWEIPWTKEPGRLQSMGWQRVRHGHDRTTEHGMAPGHLERYRRGRLSRYKVFVTRLEN